MIKNFKEKRAASLMMILGYSVVLFGLSGLLIGILISSQKFVGISERYNMSIYGAESGIEQALFEINIHDIGFNDSTNLKIPADINGFLKLNSERLKYKWSVKGINEDTNETGYLVWKGNIDKIPDSDLNKKYYKNFRKFYLYKDIGGIGENNNIVNICNTSNNKIQFSVNGTNIFTNSESKNKNIINWRINLKEENSSGTGYYLESSAECSNSTNPKDPFCYKTTDIFTHNGIFESDSSGVIGRCMNNLGNEYSDQTPLNFLNKGGDPVEDGIEIFKPELQFTYLNKLFETGDEKNGLPIKYELSSDCSDSLPSLVQEIESVAQTYGSVQKITTKIYQGEKGIDLSYAVIQ